MWPIFSSRTRWAFSSLLAKDHCIDSMLETETLKKRVLNTIESSSQVAKPVSATAKVYLLTGLRIMGIEFNPVSFYFVYEEGSANVDYVVAEVNNIPWLEQHLYVLTPEQVVDCDNSTERDGEMRRFQGHPKAFHVSPFIDMSDITYSWLIANPSKELRMKIGLQRSGKSFFMAGLHASRHRFSYLNLIRCQLTKPLQSCKVVISIMWEAAKLFRRGFEFVPHPNNTETIASSMIASVVRFHTSIYERFVVKRPITNTS